ncbi:hypothetical protein BGX38DRAFT_374132 [Terfezia claveryi]|nr:hypothetical protein BGX38DRAFT_374132 [Terfezia claveryi]
MRVSRKLLIFSALFTPTELSSNDSALMLTSIYISFSSMPCTASLRSKIVSCVKRQLQLLMKKLQNTFAPTGFRMHLSGQCILGSIALSSFKPLLQIPVKHGITS